MPTYRLRSDVLRKAAAAMGDLSGYAIAKRTGLAESTLSRLRRGHAEPTIGSVFTLANTYGLSVYELVEAQGPVA